MTTITENLEKLQNTKASIKNAIISKGQDLTNVPFTQYPDKINAIKTEKNIVNGIIEQYIAENETIEADAFVEFINNACVEIDTQLSNTSNSGFRVSAAYVGNNKVFISHSINNDLCGIICTITESDIRLGSDTLLRNLSSKYISMSTICVDNNKVFIAYGSSEPLYGMICEISGDKITKVCDTQLSDIERSANQISAVYMNNNKIFIAHSNGKSYYLNGMVCTITENTIVVEIDKQLSTSASQGFTISAVRLNENSVFFAHSDGSSYSLYGSIFVISETSISRTSNLPLNTSYNTGRKISALYLNSSEVFIAHSIGDNYYLGGMICTIENNKINMYTDTLLDSVANSAFQISAVYIDNKVFITHGKDNNLSATICVLGSANIYSKTKTPLNNLSKMSDNGLAAVKINNKIFMVYGITTNCYLNTTVANLKTLAKKSLNSIDGLAKSQITSSLQGDVWVLK